MDQPSETKATAPREAWEASRPERIRQGPHLHPDVDILDRGEELLLRADMPGVGADGLDVRYENGILSISGRAKAVDPPEGRVLVREFVPYDFHREFAVGEGLDQGRISAEYQDGVLTLHLPKSEAVRPRRIEVVRK